MKSNILKVFSKKYFVVLLIWFCHIQISAQFCEDSSRFNCDYIGDLRGSIYNFTDRVIPYWGVDGWSELKFSFWFDNNKVVGLYLSGMGSYMFAQKSFGWQRYLQGAVGLQVYPYPLLFKDGKWKLFRGVRFFTLAGWRKYEKGESNPFSDYKDKDWHLGMDYYFDNIFEMDKLNMIIWTNATYRSTNFSHSGYKNILWVGNLKIGKNLRNTNNKRKQHTWLPYLTLDWSYANSCNCRWWENYLRGGGGIRLYPFSYVNRSRNVLVKNRFLQRVNVYAELLSQVTKLNLPPKTEVNGWDVRIGLSFATSGFPRTPDKIK